jgi:hypothetical protein
MGFVKTVSDLTNRPTIVVAPASAGLFPGWGTRIGS